MAKFFHLNYFSNRIINNFVKSAYKTQDLFEIEVEGSLHSLITKVKMAKNVNEILIFKVLKFYDFQRNTKILFDLFFI